ncbi:hypothetical protein ACIP5Y_11135 [Nocardia sp. NPDC088792]|uniref:hypothetical protein n=1 Tax=Nocardia sp. NPDC088792 TaxID=3364332 RepID=UPI00381E8EF3
MTNSAVAIRGFGAGLQGIVPGGGVTVLDVAAGANVMVLEVAGGHLSWNVLDRKLTPAAIIDDAELAQEWIWALYGETVALALEDGGTAESAVDPAVPALAVSAWRLAYAHWASRWWPASTLDGIPPLDQGLLDREIADLTEECDILVAGADALLAPSPAPIEIFPRAADYALAAGDPTQRPGALVLARGATGWDWRHCPPGLLDASERAISWQVIRAAGATTVAISAATAPGTPTAIPAHLRPWVRIETPTGTTETPLTPTPGAWTGETPAPGAESAVHFHIHLPGFGPGEIPTAARPEGEFPSPAAGEPDADGAGDADAAARPSPPDEVESAAIAREVRRRVREFAAGRLRAAAGTEADAGFDAPLLAEIAAAAEDSDF